MNQQCKVCGEPAAGFHFGAFTCEGCKVSVEFLYFKIVLLELFRFIGIPFMCRMIFSTTAYDRLLTADVWWWLVQCPSLLLPLAHSTLSFFFSIDCFSAAVVGHRDIPLTRWQNNNKIEIYFLHDLQKHNDIPQSIHSSFCSRSDRTLLHCFRLA